MGALDAPDHAMAMPGMAGHSTPADHKHDDGDHTCPFAGAALALAEPTVPTLDLPLVAANTPSRLPRFTVDVGHGLAAPPPPATGPPSLI
ncbi:hypothetical protein EAH87_10665 [Sphingomonas koreensis]|nr:hypothetical protein EAH87_10665 [Sphingomonas koreensis]